MQDPTSSVDTAIPFAAIVPAAGTGSRSGREIPKQFVELLGEPVLAHTLRALLAVDGCREIVVAIDERWRELVERCAGGDLRVRIARGGAERQHSIASALETLGAGDELVLVHDAARPCLRVALVERLVRAAREHGAAIPVLPINETVKRIGPDGTVIATLPRAELRTAQTPQAFRRDVLRRAYAGAALTGLVGTDDASIVEAIGWPVHAVDGDPDNLKITVPEDFARAEEILRGMRLGGIGAMLPSSAQETPPRPPL